MKSIFTLVDHCKAKICFSWVRGHAAYGHEKFCHKLDQECLKVGPFHFNGAVVLSVRWSFVTSQLRSLNSRMQLRPEALVVCVCIRFFALPGLKARV